MKKNLKIKINKIINNNLKIKNMILILYNKIQRFYYYC